MLMLSQVFGIQYLLSLIISARHLIKEFLLIEKPTKPYRLRLMGGLWVEYKELIVAPQYGDFITHLLHYFIKSNLTCSNFRMLN